MTDKQRRSNARNALFRQIHGNNLEHLMRIAEKEEAISNIELCYLTNIIYYLNTLKNSQFINSKLLGFNPRRRCAYCKNIAYWKANIIKTETYLCNKHKEEVERDNKQNINGEWMVTDIHKINPYE